MDWIFHSGTTPSNGTGPNSAYDGDIYIYNEMTTGVSDSCPSPGEGFTSSIISPYYYIPYPSYPYISFKFVARGDLNEMGTIYVDAQEKGDTTWSIFDSVLVGNSIQWFDFRESIIQYQLDTMRFRIRQVSGPNSGDNNGDFAVDHIWVSEGIEKFDVTCHGGNDGRAHARAMFNLGGNYPESFVWSTGDSTAEVTGLSAGTYTVTITRNSTTTQSITINQPPLPSAPVISGDTSICVNNLATVHLEASFPVVTRQFAHVTEDVIGTVVGEYLTYPISFTPRQGFALSDAEIKFHYQGDLDELITWNNMPEFIRLLGEDSTLLMDSLQSQCECYRNFDYGYATVPQTTMNTWLADGSLSFISKSTMGANESCLGHNAKVRGMVEINYEYSDYYPYWFDQPNQISTATAVDSGYSVYFNPDSTTTYYVMYFDTCGNYSSYDSSIVNVYDPPIVTVTPDSTVYCGNVPAALAASGAQNYLWTPGVGLNSNTTANVLASPLNSTIYQIVGTDTNQCKDTTTAEVTVTTGLTITGFVSTNASCFGGSDGTAGVSVSGAVGPVSYNWSNGDTSSAISSLPAGNYSVTVSDNTLCTDVQTFIISEPSAIQISLASSNPCFGSSNGWAQVIAIGGTGAKTFAWSNGSTNSFNFGLSAVMYSVTVTDANGCTQSDSIILVQPTSALSVSTLSISNANCNGGNDGVISVQASGGTPGYSYNWSNGASGATVSGLSAGTYIVTVTDSANCFVGGFYTITQPATSISLNIDSISPASCFGSSDANAFSSATGGTGGLSFLWSNGNTASSITNVAAGQYFVTVTDVNGCIDVDSVLLIQPDSIQILFSNTQVSCFGQNNGVSIANPSGGSGTFLFYSWSNGDSSDTSNNLAAGTYSITITDDDGCSNSASTIISEPAMISADIEFDSVSCFGLSDGTADASATGGTAPYTFLWSNGSIADSIGGLSPSTYSVSITDANGCTAMASGNVQEPNLLQVSATASNNVGCLGGNNGQATANVTGGTPGFTFSWSSGSTFQVADMLTTGGYSVTATDANGCSATDSVFITQPASTVIVSVDSLIGTTCYDGNDGQAFASASGGTGIINLNWSNGDTGPIAAGLSSGTYTITATDINGCTAIDTVFIDQPDSISITFNTIPTTCFGYTDGSSKAIASGGSGSFIAFAWSTGANIDSISGLNAGNYVITITDDLGCSNSATSVISEPTPIVVSFSTNSVSCFGSSDGTAAASASGGNGGYTYLWSTGESSSIISGKLAGMYSLTVSDLLGCSLIDSVEILQPSAITISTSVLNNVSCFSGQDGSAEVTPNGGTPPYSYLWSFVSTGSIGSNLASGWHQISLTDNNGCTAIDSVFISQPAAAVQISVDSVDQVKCFNGSDGSISISITGGTGIHTYLWSNSLTSSAITALNSGIYSVTATDANGCTDIETITINEPDSLEISFNNTNPSCFGFADGSVSSAVIGGFGAYSYAWSNGSTSNSISSLATGSYTLTVTDDNSCQTIESATLTQPDSLDLTITESSSILCNGNSNGELTASAVGGTSPYAYAWSNGASSSINSNLIANLYSFTVTDANGCQKTASANLTEPNVLAIQMDSVLDVSCFGLNDGNAAVSASGGTGAITYLWSNGIATPNASALVSGSYSVTATDANGCAVNTSLSISEPTEITLTLSSSDVTCFGGNDGQAAATASNGQGVFTYVWSNGNTSAINASLSAQSYTVTVTDAAGCFKVDTALIDEPSQLVSSYTTSNNACFGDSTGQITTAVSGGTLPYTYSWSTGETAASIDSLIEGSYAVTITDSNGCQLDSTFTLSQPTALVLSIDSTSDLLCFNDASGSIGASASGGTSAYSFLWNDNATSAIRSGIAAGTYSLTLTDANGCEEDTSLTITEPPLLSIQVNAIQDLLCFGDTNGSIDAIANGGTSPINYAWSSGENTAQISNLVAGNYTLTVTDANGCMADSVIALSQPDSIAINASIILALCDNTNDGSIATSVSGGVAPYSYAWSNSETSDSIGNLSAGNYSLTVADANSCSSTQLITLGFEFTAPQPLLGNDTGYCTNDSLELHASVLGATYGWSTGDSTASITIQNAGTYSVFVTETTGCSGSDTIEIVEFELPTFDLGNDTILCIADLELGLELIGPDGQASYAWSTGGNQSTETVTSFGTYFLTVESDEGCRFTDSISIANDTCVGISDAARERSILIYPNPNFGQFTVNGGLLTEKNTQLKIYNADGRLVLQRSTQSATEAINLSLHGAGVYYVHFLKDSAPVSVKKVVVY